jgi:hypothetical protein
MCVLAGSLGCSQSPGFAVELSIRFDDRMSDATLSSIASLAVATSGDEIYEAPLVLGRPVARVERILYRPAASSRSIEIHVSAKSRDGAEVGAGDAGPIGLTPGAATEVELVINDSSQLDGGTDGASLDLAGSDAAIDASAPPDMTDTYRARILADHPVAYYRFDEMAGTNAADETGNGNDATYFGSYALGATAAIHRGHGVQLTAAPGGIVVSNVLFDTSGNHPYSLEAWVSPASLGPGGCALFALAGNDANGLQAITLAWSSFYGMFRFVDGVQNSNQVTTLALNSFTHIVLEYDGASLSFFENGIPDVSIPAATPGKTIPGSLYIGANNGQGGTFIGTFDEVAVYNYALTAAQVKAHHDVGLAP